ncbi:stage V sporulation protein B [Alicyclobacillus sp.]|uniref:stage V sporulation protein B n=1 Tax=Alicyclobacillus sp. TaxID=61169 RepID=UPI0025C45EFB|nr:stage V sporulation protein B [Alicyclobacillus sp.]MCL6516515.1 stage V sporulation protein B [Alicyclobacillus sp.]
MIQRSFLHGTLVLMLSGVITRILGFVYRIYLSRLIGAEGMGLFQMVWPLTSLALTFITAGLPIAISKLVAEAYVQRDRARITRIMRISTGVIVTMAILVVLLMWGLRGFILHHWFTDPRAYLTYQVMIPIVLVIAISSIYRGYFQGLQDMSPTAWASVLETIARIGVVYALAGYFIRYGIAAAAAAAMAGTVCGEVVGLGYLILQQRRRGRLDDLLPEAPARSLETVRQTIRAMAELAVPVTVSRLIWSFLWAVEPILVTRALMRAGATGSEATGMYGQYGSMAVPLLVFPTVFTASLAANLVPSVSEAMAEDAVRRVRIRFAQSWRATALIGMPVSVLFTLFAHPLCWAIYHDDGVAPILQVMAPIGFLIYLQGPLTAILQGLNHATIAMAISILGGVMRLGLIWELASQPHLGVLGVAWATTAANVVTLVLYCAALYRYIGLPVDVADTAKIAIASLVMLVVCDLLTPDRHPLGVGRMLAAMAGGGLVYFALCCAFRVITSNAMRRIPKVGGALAALVRWMPFGV